MPHYREPLKPGAIADWDYMVERTAAEPAWWEPGTRQGYHGLSYAWTVGNLVRLAAGGAGQRQRAEVRSFFTQQQLRAGAQQHAAVGERHVEVKAGGVLGDQSLHQRAAVDAVAGGNIDKP